MSNNSQKPHGHQNTAAVKSGHLKQRSYRNFKRDADRAMKVKTVKTQNKPQGFA